MTAGYLICAVFIACLCTAFVLSAGGSLMTGLMVYVVSGQLVMLGLVARAVYSAAATAPRR